MERAPTFPMADLGPCTYLSEEPSIRFPAYTRGNVGEVWPDAVYPLSFSMARAPGIDHLTELVTGPGLATEGDLAEGITTLGAVFGGYQYLNLSFQRVMAVRAPGTTIEAADRTFLSSNELAPPHEPHPDDKNLRASIASLRYGLGLLRTKELPQLAEDRALVDGWQRRTDEVLAAETDELLRIVDELNGVVAQLFANHVDVTNKAGAALQLLAAICEDRLDDRSLALTLLGGLGDVDSAAPSAALWHLGRLVVADGGLTAEFDRGVDALEPRLVALAAGGDEAAGGFLAEFDRFCDRFGSRGQNEWESASETWGIDRSRPLALVDRMRGADETHDPTKAGAALRSERDAAVEAARSRLGRLQRWNFDRTLRAATLYSQARERAKTTVVDLIHVARLALRELASRAASEVEGGTVLDMWYVGYHELADYLADPAAFQSTIAERRAARDEVVRREPPFAFSGALPPFESWPLRPEATGGDDPGSAADKLQPGAELTGVGGCAGVAEGRARIVTDPTDPGDIGPGDVLVAPLTDPSWTPLFVPVEAVVVDVGGQMSHAVIVARELGQPCVVAATGATTRIPDGAMIRVDGSAGTVTVLEADA